MLSLVHNNSIKDILEFKVNYDNWHVLRAQKV